MKKKEPENLLKSMISKTMEDPENSIIGQAQFQMYIEPLIAGGYTYAEAKEFIRKPLTIVLQQASKEIPQSIISGPVDDSEHEFMDSIIGTIWFEDGKPKTDYGSSCIKQINSRLKDLSKAGVKPEDIRNFWNLNYMDRHGVYLMSLVKAQVAFLEAQKQFAQSGPLADLTPEIMTEGATLTYAPVGSKVLFGNRDALPAEASIRAPHLIAEFISQADNFEFLEAVTTISMNGLARVLLKG
jgi:hypothetical protein